MKRDRIHPARRRGSRRARGKPASPDPAVGGAEAFLDRVAIVETGGGVPHGWIAVAVIIARVAMAVDRAIVGATRPRRDE